MASIVSKRLDRLSQYLFVQVRQGLGHRSAYKPIDLSVGDPDEGVNQQILEEAFRVALRAKGANRYPPGRGQIGLRRAIARWMQDRYGARFDPEREIAVCSGSKEGIAHLIHVLIDPGQKLLTGSLAYPVYGRAAGLAGGTTEILTMEENNGFWLDYAKSKGGKAICFNYPNNPTGACVTREHFKELTAWAKKKDVFMISDAAYNEMSFGNRAAPSIFEIPQARGRAVEFHSFSKSFGLPGLRLGWVCGEPDVISALLKLKDTYDSGVCNWVQSVGQFLLEMPERDAELRRLRAIYGRRRAVAEEALGAMGFGVFRSGATFYVWARPGRSHFTAELKERVNVLTVPGEGFGPGGNSYMRFALCQSEGRIKEALARVASVVDLASGRRQKQRS
ncbi:MAG: aminotransferase class I/II-fold pyridoxal phosphate-dependent enzyme [Elusimicrobia bacterium]|nr:aminotransferase class I/II-fold pyridoxal phosphate-dependent enzyme [Elusimicrobiota bacterium]